MSSALSAFLATAAAFAAHAHANVAAAASTADLSLANPHSDEWTELIPSEPNLLTTHLIYLLLGAFIVTFGLFSLIIKDRMYMSEALVATLFGIVIGPVAGNIFNPIKIFGEKDVQHVTLEVARLVIAIQCLVAGISVPSGYVWKEFRSISMLVGPLMICMWIMSAFAVWAVTGIPWTYALVVAACVTPTDPVLANSIVKGAFAEKHISKHIRLLISAESGINDGLGLPFLFLTVYLARYSTGQAIGLWLLKIILYQIVLSVAAGMAIGLAARKLLKLAENNGWIDKESILGFFIALVLFTTGALSVLGIDDVFGCFFVGTVLSWDGWFNRQIEESHIQEVIDALINMTFFIFFGALIPWSEFGSIDMLAIWKLVLLSIWILALRRLPFVMLMRYWIPVIKDGKEALFVGWFGPIGVGAIFYTMFAQVYLEVPLTPMFPIVTFIVLSSIIVHGGTVSLFELGLTRHESWQSNRAARNIAAINAANAADKASADADADADATALAFDKDAVIMVIPKSASFPETDSTEKKQDGIDHHHVVHVVDTIEQPHRPSLAESGSSGGVTHHTLNDNPDTDDIQSDRANA